MTALESPRSAYRRRGRVGRDRTDAVCRAVRARRRAAGSASRTPGWYRYKVGSFEVSIVTDGAQPSPMADGYVANAQKAGQ